MTWTPVCAIYSAPPGIASVSGTTNLLERAFLEVRRRSRATPRFFDERGCMKLIFATLLEVSGRWQRIQMSERECAQLDRLRRQLGIVDTPAQVDDVVSVVG